MIWHMLCILKIRSGSITVIWPDSPPLNGNLWLITHNWIVIPPASTKLKGGYTGITLSVCQSVCLWTDSCPLCIFDFVFFWLGIQYDSMVWVINRRGVSSECMRSSCSSYHRNRCFGIFYLFVPYSSLRQQTHGCTPNELLIYCTSPMIDKAWKISSYNLRKYNDGIVISLIGWPLCSK